MDLLMILILAICFGSMKLLVDWCEKQVGTAATVVSTEL